ncbi:transposase [Nitrosospira multiformis]|nr:transposase [Nitrosospira multiformis]
MNTRISFRDNTHAHFNSPYPRDRGAVELPCRALNLKLHAVCDGRGKPVALLLSEDQMSDYKGAALLLPALPKAKELLADCGYDADRFRATLREKGITPCIPSKKNRKMQIEYDRELYK